MVKRLAHGSQTVSGTAGQGDARPASGGGEVLSSQLAGEPGGPVDDDVELSIGCISRMSHAA